MNIQLTPAALARLQEVCQLVTPKLYLLYDNEGCGCAVNGVPHLLVVQQTPAYVAIAQSEGAYIYFNPLHAIYFEEQMTIDYQPERMAFTLKSSQQIYTNDLRISGIADSQSRSCSL
jgi:uncharacterized protein YqkB